MGKSKELRSFLHHNGLAFVLRDLASAPRPDDEVISVISEAIAARGGDIPVHMLNLFNPEVRFLTGRQRMMQFLETHPAIEVFNVDTGLEELRCRLRPRDGAAQPEQVEGMAAL